MSCRPQSRMEDLLGHGPPLVLFLCREGALQRHVNRPPFLGAGVSLHFGGVRGEVRAMILPVPKEQIFRFAQKDRVIRDVAPGDHRQHFRPDSGVQVFVFGDMLRPDPDNHAHSLHGVSPAERRVVAPRAARIRSLASSWPSSCIEARSEHAVDLGKGRRSDRAVRQGLVDELRSCSVWKRM